VRLYRDERQYYHLPFWGLTGSTPQIQIGEGQSWVDMTADLGYVPPADWSAPDGLDVGDADWFKVLLAGPDATGNPIGTIVLTTTTRIRTRIAAGDEIDIQPDVVDEWIHLVS
jgi:hypothetical protein